MDYHGAVTYTVVISNATTVSDTNALFTDTLPVSVAFGSWIVQPAGASESGAEITWSGTLTNNTAITFSFTADHTGDYEDVITNTAEYSGSVVISDTATFTVVSGDPNIAVVKTADPDTDVAYHGEVTYTVKLSNVGVADDASVLFTDTLPAEVDFSRWIVSPTHTFLSSDEITWTGYITAGEGVTFTFIVAHTGDLGDLVTNTAEFSGTVNAGFDDAIFTVVAPDLAIEKTVTPVANVTRGGTVTYTILVTNSGGVAANGVILTDTLPAEADFTGWVISPTGTLVSDDEITWSGNVASGEVLTWTFTAEVTGTLGFTVVNTATIEYDGDLTDAAATFRFETASIIIINEVDADTSGIDALEFVELYDGGVGNTPLDGLVVVFYNGLNDASYSPSPFSSGIDLDGYTTDANGYFVIGNTAITNASIVVNDNQIQNGADAVALHIGDGADFPNNTPVTTADLVDAIVYDTDDGDDAGLLVLLNASQPQVNEGGAGSSPDHSNQRCPNGSGGARNTDTYVQNPPTPGGVNYCPSELSVAKMAAPATNVAYHGPITYTVILSNTGYTDEPAALLTDTLPVSVTFGGWIEQPLGAVESSDEITWTGAVTTGQIITFSFVVSHTGDYEDVVVNTANVSGTYNTASDDATFTVIAATPELVVSKTGPAVAVSGKTIVYEVTIENNGALSATNVVLSDTLPISVTYVSDDSGKTCPACSLGASGVITWDVGDILSTDVFRFNLTATVDVSVTHGTVITNEVEASTDAAGDDPANNSDDAESTVYALITIAEARQLANGETAVVAGTVSAEPGIFVDSGTNRKIYIQDGTAGILVYRSGGLDSVARGNRVMVVGAMAEYRTERELMPANTSDVTDLGADTPVSPVMTDTGAISESLEGQLAQIVGEIVGKPAAYRLQVDDGSGVVEVYQYYNLGDPGDPNYIDFTPFVVGDYISAVGVTRGYDYSGEVRREVMPRGPADIIEFPRVLSTNPADGAVGVDPTADIQATFNMTVTNVDAATFLLAGPSGAVAGAVSYDDATMTATFDPDADLDFDTTYTATLVQAIENEGGETMVEDYVWTFRTVSALELTVAKTGPDTIVGGEQIVYAITLQTTGWLSATNVVLTDTLPMSVTYDSDNSGVTPTNPDVGVYVWDLGDLLPNTTNTFHLTATVSSDIADNTVITNTVEVATDAPSDDPANNHDQWETTVSALVSIYDIQYTTDPIGNSPYMNQQVTTEGIVTADFGNEVFIQDGPGAWNGVMLYHPDGTLTLGDYVRVTGVIQEYYNLTEFASGADTIIISSGNPLPAFQVLPTGDVAQEQYESVLVRVENATVTDEDLGYGEWEIDDGSGGVRVDDRGSYVYAPADGDVLKFLQGPLYYGNGDFKIEPRDDSDIGFSEASIVKYAPTQVDPGDTFTYTLTVENKLGFDLSDVVITDAVPADVTFAYALDGGAETGGVVSWSLANLANGSSASVRFVVTVTGSLGEVIVNDDYAVSAANYVTPTFGLPVNTIIGELRIYHVQGDGAVSPYLDREVTVEGVVLADFQASDELDGFFMQDAAGDGDPLTSDGIFVYATQAVNAGDWVEVTGLVDEHYGLTQLDTVSAIGVISSGNTIAPTVVTLPEQTNGDLERYEGMLVTLPHTMTVEQNYFQGRYGQVTLAAGGRLYQPTHVYAPGSAAAIALADENARRLLILDDGSSDQNPDPIPYIGDDDTLRAGDVVSAGLTGVLDSGPINSSSPPATDYRLHPTAAVNITRVNARTDTPTDVGGRLQAASFNVLNYFNGDGLGGGFPTSRGATTLVEFNRQRAKIITAVLAIDADVVGLMEIENDGYDANSAIQDLVNGLNDVAGADTYAFIDPGVSVIGTDEIAVGLLYKPSTVTPVGPAAILDSTFDPAYIDTLNRPALAQTFAENATGEKFTAVVNHLKSKGSACAGDPDTGDGQGNCNLTRTRAMTVEVAWLATDPTGSGDPDFIILGDLNSYAMEDPITVARDAGYTDLLQQFVGTGAYSYIFDGMSGYLDHALANPSLNPQITGATHWHINADEPAVIDYNTEYKPQDLYAPTAFCSSDHDPVIVGLDLVNQTALTVTKSVVPTADVPLNGGVVTYTVVVRNDGTAEATGVVLTDTLPPEVDFGAWVDRGSAQPPAPTADVITWGPWPVAAGESYTFTFTAVVTPPAIYEDTVVNAVEFTSADAGSGFSNDAVFTVEPGQPALSIVKAVTPTADVPLNGGVVTYTVVVRNDGTAEATGVVLTDTLPPEVDFGAWVDRGSAQPPAPTADVITWGPWPVAAGKSYTFTFTAVVTPPAAYEDTVTNNVEFTSVNAGDGFSNDAVFTVESEPQPQEPDLSTSTKSSSSPGAQLMPGDLVTYTVTLSNTSSVAANALVTDVLGSYYTVYNALDFTETTTGTLTWSGAVAGNDAVTLHFVAQVVDMADLRLGATTLSNTAVAHDGYRLYTLPDAAPPYVEVYGIFLPLVARNY